MKTSLLIVLCFAGAYCVAADVVFSSPTPSTRANRSDVQSKAFRLAVGDEVMVKISVPSDLGTRQIYSGTSIIAPDGQIAMPRVGRIQATGITQSELARAIEKRLPKEPGLGTVSSVTVSTSGGTDFAFRNVAVRGRVKQTGASNRSLLDAHGPGYRERRQGGLFSR